MLHRYISDDDISYISKNIGVRCNLREHLRCSIFISIFSFGFRYFATKLKIKNTNSSIVSLALKRIWVSARNVTFSSTAIAWCQLYLAMISAMEFTVNFFKLIFRSFCRLRVCGVSLVALQLSIDKFRFQTWYQLSRLSRLLYTSLLQNLRINTKPCRSLSYLNL